ncbi:MAG: TonB family protein [Bacteroidota bacterium]|uniref:Energy transducer TonB n=1 Tax=Flagellimonas profundi TaxID=2915620 RepID=A0ABS3FJ33_9FLAO|nr:energy transducer TonB [Allomuricauda profundi]MBO0342961.1 energy transducer TonB [Allomuricauda profundi]MEC7772572.1 TonB family protein [Bacteroidota bacterium]
MEPKKNPQLDVKRNSLLYFFVGMTLVLLMAYLALEWKSYYPSADWETSQVNPDLLIEEEPPITFQKLELPKPKIQTPPIIDVVEDEKDIEETVIEASEPDQNTEIAPIESIDVAEDDVPDEIPFVLIENAPVFPGCENEKTEEDKRTCFQEQILNHIRKNFRYPEVAKEMGLQGRVSVIFTVQKDGSIGNVRLRGPHESLEKEAARIISKLPRLTPGKQRGTPVKVPYSIPITFKLN